MNVLSNVLVGGATKQGKTDYLKTRITAILKEKGHSQIEIIVFDTKKSGEYDEFSGNILIYKSHPEIMSVLTSIECHIESRDNNKKTKQMIVLVIDEYGDLVPGEFMCKKTNAALSTCDD